MVEIISSHDTHFEQTFRVSRFHIYSKYKLFRIIMIPNIHEKYLSFYGGFQARVEVIDPTRLTRRTPNFSYHPRFDIQMQNLYIDILLVTYLPNTRTNVLRKCMCLALVRAFVKE